MVRARQKDTESRERKRAADQPRPALGRRPWFALLRRARSLRRFAFAIRPESVARSRLFLTMVDRDGSWSAAPVLLASSHGDRRLGVRTGFPRVLLRGSRVHARGLDEPLVVVGLDVAGVVTEVRIIHPGAFARLRSATWTLELPTDAPVPAMGARLAIYPR